MKWTPTQSMRCDFNPSGTMGMRRRAVRGGAVTGAGQALAFAIRFGATAILARQLVPADFGLVAIVAVVAGFVGMFTDAGLTIATVQQDRITHEQVSSLFWINAALGCLLAATLAALAYPIAAVYEEPRLVGIAHVLSVTFVLAGLTVQHQALLRRAMRFKTIVVVNTGSLLLGAATGAGMAVAGYGYWSLVGMAIATAIGKASLSWALTGWVPGGMRRGSGVRPMLRVGGDVLCFDTVNYFARNADNLLIGWYWGAGALGFYEKAYSLVIAPIAQINAPLSSVAIPALSRLKTERERYANFVLHAIQLQASIVVPIIILLTIYAHEVTRIWLGPGWERTAILFQLLGIAATIRALTNPTGWLLISLGYTKRYRNLGLLNSFVIVLAFIVGLPFGSAGVAVSYSIAMAILFVPTWWITVRGTPLAPSQIFSSIAHPLAAGLIAGATTYALAFAKPDSVNGMTWRFGGVGFFIMAYLSILLGALGRWSFYRSIVTEFRAAS